MRAAFETDGSVCGSQQKQFEERQVTRSRRDQVREIEESLHACESELRSRAEEIVRLGQQQQEADELGVQAKQILEMRDQLAEERRLLRERAEKQAPLEQSRLALQDQLRRRSEELAERQRSLAEQARAHAEAVGSMDSKFAELEQARQAVEKERADWDQGKDERQLQIDRLSGDLARQENRVQTGMERLRLLGRKFGARRKAHLSAEADFAIQRRQSQEMLTQAQSDLAAAQQALTERLHQLPDLEQQAQDAVLRLEESRGQLRAHLTELHGYARASREDVDSWRGQVRAQAEEVERQARSLHQAREDHRLAVAAFRQQLIEWQGQVNDLKRTLAQAKRACRPTSRGRRAGQRMDAASLVLAEQAEVLQEQEKAMAREREEVVGHSTMREWYRRKIRGAFEEPASRIREARSLPREMLSSHRKD